MIEINDIHRAGPDFTELFDVYDLIEVTRHERKISSRQLAIDAKIAPTTLASLISRRPDTIKIDDLSKIAKVFEMTWCELLNKPESFAEKYALETRVPVSMTKEDIIAVSTKLGNKYSFDSGLYREDKIVSNPIGAPRRKRAVDIPESNSEFMRSIALLLGKLTDEGLILAMRQIIDIVSDPKYTKSSNDNKQEDTE